MTKKLPANPVEISMWSLKVSEGDICRINIICWQYNLGHLTPRDTFLALPLRVFPASLTLFGFSLWPCRQIKEGSDRNETPWCFNWTGDTHGRKEQKFCVKSFGLTFFFWNSTLHGRYAWWHQKTKILKGIQQVSTLCSSFWIVLKLGYLHKTQSETETTVRICTCRDKTFGSDMTVSKELLWGPQNFCQEKETESQPGPVKTNFVTVCIWLGGIWLPESTTSVTTNLAVESECAVPITWKWGGREIVMQSFSGSSILGIIHQVIHSNSVKVSHFVRSITPPPL